MPKFAVHLYPTVRVKVVGIDANSVEEAIKAAEEKVDLHQTLDRPGNVPNVEFVGWDEGPNNFIFVDQLNEKTGEVDDDAASCWLDGDGNPLVNGKTPLERKADAADAANLFMTELLDSVETLGGIAEEHGARTLADLMYLQSAILTGAYIDSFDSNVTTVVKRLPSADRWMEFIHEESVSDRPKA